MGTTIASERMPQTVSVHPTREETTPAVKWPSA